MQRPRRDAVEWTSAFLLGALIGGSATLLVAPDRAPWRKKRSGRVRRVLGRGRRERLPALLSRLRPGSR